MPRDVLISDSLVRRTLNPGNPGESLRSVAAQIAWCDEFISGRRDLWILSDVLPPHNLAPDTWLVRFIERPPDRAFHLHLNEEQRQMVLLACATLALERPGLQNALEELTKDIDRPNKYPEGKHTMMQEFMRLNADRHGKAKRIEVEHQQNGFREVRELLFGEDQ